MTEENQKNKFSVSIKPVEAETTALEHDEETINSEVVLETKKYTSVNSGKTILEISKANKTIIKRQKFGAFKTVVSGKKEKNKTFITVSLEQKHPDAVPPKPSDEELMNAIGNLLHGDPSTPFLTIDRIYRKQHGLKAGKASKAEADKLKRQIENLSNINMKLDASEQIKMMQDKGIEVENNTIASISRPLLEFYTGTAVLDGNLTDGYFFRSLPPTFEYSLGINHVVTVPDNYLNLSHNKGIGITPFSNTGDRSIINRYILKRVKEITNSKRKSSNVILYSTIFAEVELEKGLPLTRKQESGYRKVIEQNILPSLKNEKEISDYEIIDERIGNKHIYKVVIHPPKKSR